VGILLVRLKPLHTITSSRFIQRLYLVKIARVGGVRVKGGLIGGVRVEIVLGLTVSPVFAGLVEESMLSTVGGLCLC